MYFNAWFVNQVLTKKNYFKKQRKIIRKLMRYIVIIHGWKILRLTENKGRNKEKLIFVERGKVLLLLLLRRDT